MADLNFSFPPATVGENYVLPIAIYDEMTGAAPDLSTYTGDFQVRLAPGAPLILEASSANGQLQLFASAPQILISFPFGQLSQSGVYTGELKLTDASGIVSKPIGGQFPVQTTITP